MMAFLAISVCTEAETDINSIVGNAFRGNSASSFTPMSDGEHYLMSTGKCIIRYSFKTGTAVDTLFNVETVRGERLPSFDGFILSPKEDRILIQSGHTKIFRNSFNANLLLM